MGQPGSQRATVGYHCRPGFWMPGRDRIERTARPLEKGQSLLPAWESEGQIAAILPARVQLRHRFSKTVQSQAADLTKIHLAQVIADDRGQTQAPGDGLGGLV